MFGASFAPNMRLALQPLERMLGHSAPLPFVERSGMELSQQQTLVEVSAPGIVIPTEAKRNGGTCGSTPLGEVVSTH
jgi:hypothetical protein